MMKETKVLVVDDERRYRELLEMDLSRRGYHVFVAADGLRALQLVEEVSPDLVLLDVMLPDLDGYEVCRRIREVSTVPVIMLTARVEEADKVRGLRIGADDYVTKPFSAIELLARVEAVLRRAEPAHQVKTRPFERAGLRIDFGDRHVLVEGREIELTAAEYRLLSELAQNAGRVMVHDELLRRVWGSGYEGASDLLHTAIRRLRVKIEADPTRPSHVLTKRGVGYFIPQT
ncbi:MAG TPA: response regulator transcription factor [Candidatus Acidoferrales bacterium]|nr:response regulator transcription factor [Candidatus Acidoferrales bacterium]